MSEIIKIPSVRGTHLLLLGEGQMESIQRMQAGSQAKASPSQQPAWKLGPVSYKCQKLNLINNLHELGTTLSPETYRKAHSLDLCLVRF